MSGRTSVGGIAVSWWQRDGLVGAVVGPVEVHLEDPDAGGGDRGRGETCDNPSMLTRPQIAFAGGTAPTEHSPHRAQEARRRETAATTRPAAPRSSIASGPASSERTATPISSPRTGHAAGPRRRTCGAVEGPLGFQRRRRGWCPSAPDPAAGVSSLRGAEDPPPDLCLDEAPGRAGPAFQRSASGSGRPASSPPGQRDGARSQPRIAVAVGIPSGDCCRRPWPTQPT